MKFGDKLKELRDAAGLTQWQLAEKVGLSQSTIAFFEGGKKTPGRQAVADLAGALGVSENSLSSLLKVGTRAHEKYKFHLPHYGEVPCGTPIDVNTPPEPESLDVFTPLVGQPGRFLLTAKGRSMTGRGIEEGDKLVIQKQPVVSHGQLAVVVIDEKVTLKVFKVVGRRVYLDPASDEDEHKRIEYVEGRDRIQGVVVGLVRKL